jgi:hypothetical protein
LEDTESAQLDALTTLHGLLHRFQNRFHRLLDFTLVMLAAADTSLMMSTFIMLTSREIGALIIGMQGRAVKQIPPYHAQNSVVSGLPGKRPGAILGHFWK